MKYLVLDILIHQYHQRYANYPFQMTAGQWMSTRLISNFLGTSMILAATAEPRDQHIIQHLPKIRGQEVG